MCDIDKSKVVGLPPHAQIQKIRQTYYVFFAYCFAIKNKRWQERDYLGKVDVGNMVFVPNPYYEITQPQFYDRPLERWRNLEKRQRERDKIPPPSPVIEPNERATSGQIIKPAQPMETGVMDNNFPCKVEARIDTTGQELNTAINDNVSSEPASLGINAVTVSGLNVNSGLDVNSEIVRMDGLLETDHHHEDPTAGVQLSPLGGECEHNYKIGNECKTTQGINLENRIINAGGLMEALNCDPSSRLVGATALCFALLEQTAMTADLGNKVFHGEVKPTMDVLNLAVHAAVTSKSTYLAGPESLILQFISDGCLKSPRASEFFQRIGSGEDILMELSQARVARLGKGHLLALDGTCVDCSSRKISLSEIGKKKDGTFGPQINLSVLMDTDVGSVIGMRTYAGNVNDIKTVDDYLNMWDAFGINEKDPILTFDRSFGSAETLVKLNNKDLRYIIGLKTGLVKIRSIIEDNRQTLSSGRSLLGHHDCYGVREPVTFTDGDDSADIEAFVYRNPQKEMDGIHEFREKLNKFEGQWEKGKYDMESPLLEYFINPKAGYPLRRNEERIDEKCNTFGFFALASNVEGLSKDEALTKYDMRGDVETSFGLMFKHLIGSTRVHSTPALIGLMLVIFTGLDVLTTLRTRMKGWMPLKPKSKKTPKQVRDLHSISSVLSQLNHIRLQRYSNGKIALVNVTEKDRELVAALGLPGFFDSPQRVHDIFTMKHLSEVIQRG